MKCPKCEYETNEGACPRCGVVFQKLGRERAARPAAPRPMVMRQPEPERTLGSSILNIAVLSTLLCAGGYYGLKSWQGPQPIAPQNAVAVETARDSEPTADIELTVAQPEPVVLSGFRGPSEPGASGAVPEPEADIPELPDLNEASVTPALLARAKDIAGERPGVEWLREYVIAAHLLAAGREIRERRYRTALQYLDECDDWGAPSGDIASFRAVIYAAEEEWEPALRWAETAIAYGSKTNPAEMRHIVGKAHYYREEMSKAIESFQKALDIREDPTIRASLQRAIQEAQTADGFESQRLAHFIVRYEGGSMEDTGRMVMDTMDRSYSSLVSQFGFEPSERVVVILYSRRDYREIGPDWSAGLFDGKIRVPVRGLERLDENIKTTLHHELAHAFIHAKAGKSAPAWLHEGLAEYVEGTRTERNGKQLASVINSGQTFEVCLQNRASCDQRLFYPAAASLVDYMIQKRGMGGIRDVLSALEDGDDIDGSLNRVLGYDVSGLIRDWEHFIRRRYS